MGMMQGKGKTAIEASFAPALPKEHRDDMSLSKGWDILSKRERGTNWKLKSKSIRVHSR